MEFTNESYYTWGDGCEAWKLTDTPELSVIRELMPSGTSEKMHFHHISNQVFYILSGIATFEIEGEQQNLSAHQYIRIEAGKKHKISNIHSDSLEFIVISQPRSHGDRIEIE